MSKSVRSLAIAASAAVLLGFTAPTAWAAPPALPSLVAPASGTTATTADVPLSVTATDPDGDALTVRFEGRKVGATQGNASAPFTLVAIPDTQSYTYGGHQSLMTQQTQWIVNSRSTLNTAMVVGLGDLVETYTNTTMWSYADASQKVLDDAAVPNSVVPGNHDFDNTTGQFTQYDTYFPPSRYLGKVWSPTTASYGGYLGQNLFGADPIDRRNMDNFFLFSAGGTDFLVLNLEWEAPQYALDWAAKVLAAYPNRVGILVTHSFLQISGGRNVNPERPGATSQTGLWNFVAANCAIRLVLAGHVHDGDLGEVNRTDNNQCGKPVQQIVSDYQSRANGGNGWLRYYTFNPAADTMTAVTYSPTLDQYETDANSSFTLPFDLADTEPAPFTTIGTSQISSGGTASTTWTGLDADTNYEWRAVVSDGSTSTTSATWTVRTPVPTATDLAKDRFNRTGSRWGAAEVGGTWTDSGAAYFATDGSYGQVTVAKASSGPAASLAAVSARDLTLTTDFALAAVPTGGTFYHQTTVRVNGTTFYQLAVRVLPNGSLALDLSRSVSGTSTALGSVSLASFGYTAGDRLNVRLDAVGSSPTSLQAKVWRATSTEPAQPQLTATDSTAALQVPGSVGLKFYTGSGTTSLPTKVSVDAFRVVAAGTVQPPTNQPPTASFSATPKSWQLAVDASASTDDGSIAGYAWDYGDGTTGTGKTASHGYTADGTYAVKLTVTDNQGATASLTRQVTVTNTAPAASFVTTAKSWKVSMDASASTDDGSIAGYAWDYGDGSTGTGKTDSHTYSADGTFTVTLTVTDDTGKTGVATRQVTVANSAPTASFTANTSVRTVSLDASASSDDSSVAGYAWDYGDGTTGTGKTASHTYSADGTFTVTLTVTDDTGKTGVATRQVTASTPAQTSIALDGFTRTLPSSWGTADTGGPWTITSTTMFSVDGSRGLITIPSGGRGPVATLGSVSARDVSVVTDFALDKAPVGGAYTHQVMARVTGSTSWYHLVARVETSGAVTLEIGRSVSGTSATLKSLRISGLTYAAGDRLKLRLDVVGNGTTALQAKVWRAGDSEPSTAQLSATDTTASLQGAGAVGIKAYPSSAMTSVPLVVSVTGFRVDAAGA